MIKAAYKLWLCKNEEKAFGRGPCELLRRVEKTNSLHQSAHQLGMSYNKAWRLIRLMEKRLGFPLLDKTIGGKYGGGSLVTPRAKDLMQHYGRFERDAAKAIEKAYRKHFGSWPERKGRN